MTRMSIPSLATTTFLAAALAAATGTLPGCGYNCEGEDCGSIEPSPTPVIDDDISEGFVAKHPSHWAMMRQIYQEVLVYEAPPLIPENKWYEQISWTYFLVIWEDQPDGSIKQSEKLCFADLSDIELATNFGNKTQSTVVPGQLISNLPTDVWKASLEESGTPGEDDYSVSFSVDEPIYSVWGMNLDDPFTDVCVADENDPREYDQDLDGEAGVTTAIYQEGEHFADTYICQRSILGQGPGVVGGEEATGYKVLGPLTSVTIDQTTFGSDNPVFPDDDPEVNWLQTDSFYFMVSLGDTGSCNDVTRDLFVQ